VPDIRSATTIVQRGALMRADDAATAAANEIWPT
jgi:hypothetical protein